MKFSIMDQTGHTAESFDTAKKVELDAAMKRFGELVKGERKTPFARMEAGGQAQQVKAFNPEAIEYVFVPPLQGG